LPPFNGLVFLALEFTIPLLVSHHIILLIPPARRSALRPVPLESVALDLVLPNDQVASPGPAWRIGAGSGGASCAKRVRSRHISSGCCRNLQKPYGTGSAPLELPNRE
jgi:hypothetical protein